MGDVLYLPPPEPLWFVSSEVLTNLLHVELSLLRDLIATHPELRSLLDTPVATVSERKICFTALGHRKVLEMISEMFAARYEQPSLSDEEQLALGQTNGLVTGDAPSWVLEMDRVVEQLPTHLFVALPQNLRTAGFNQNDASQMQAVQALSRIERLQMLIETVFDEQVRRLEKRWSAAASVLPSQPLRVTKRKLRRRRDKLRAERDEIIAQIAEVTGTPGEFLREMDSRKVTPQPTWQWPGSWVRAYQDPRLRRLIHQDKSRAILRARRRK